MSNAPGSAARRNHLYASASWLRRLRALRAGELDDIWFDEMFPPAVRARSQRFWTPVAVARRAAQLLEEHNAGMVLDVGSGCGKFCLVAAATAPELEFVGIEHRPHLVDVARDAAHRLRIPNAHFYVGDATRPAWNEFDGYYFFNPFAENAFAAEDRFDDTVDCSDERLVADVQRVEGALASVRVGSVVVTYRCFGGRFPGCYELRHVEPAGHNLLRVWVKVQDKCTRSARPLEAEDPPTA